MRHFSQFAASILHFVAATSVAGFVSFPNHAHAQQQTGLIMNELCCDKTTESGADEVYVLVYARSSDGRSMVARLPADTPHTSAGHWDMNNGSQPTDNASGDSHCITKKVLFKDTIKPGQHWDVVVLFMEEDGGSTKSVQDLAASLAANAPDPLVQGAGYVFGIVSQVLFVKDKDDYLGSFTVRIANSNGNITADWRTGERLIHSIPNGNDPRKREYRINGDGSNYVGWFQVE